MIRTPFDGFGKQMVRDALDGHCTVESDAEVPTSARRIDLCIAPREPQVSPPEHLGLLGRITGRAVTLEFFHNTPSGEELHMCLIKHGEFRHFLSHRRTLPPIPIQWVISSGRPTTGIDGLGFRPVIGGLRGIYESPPLHCTRLVVVSELPVVRDTLLVRLLGAGSVLKLAIAELLALPEDAPERGLALPLLLRSHLTMPTDPVQQTSEQKEFLMTTQEIVENWERQRSEELRQQILQELRPQVVQEVRQELRPQVVQEVQQEAVVEGERTLLRRQVRRRFGAAVDGDMERRMASASVEQIELWAERVLSAATLAELFGD